MKRAQYQAWLLGVTLLSLLCLEPVSATSPTFLIVYGDTVPSPVVIQCNPDASAEFLWNTSRGYAKHVEAGSLRSHTIPDGLSGRPYLKVAIFWGRQDPTTKPEGASQHARLYLPQRLSLRWLSRQRLRETGSSPRDRFPKTCRDFWLVGC
jgi:hypothetical protein